MGLNSLLRFDVPSRILTSSGTRGATSLNSSYVHRTIGAAFAVRFSADSTVGLSSCRVFLDATSGTRTNVSLRARLYAATNASQPSTILIATADTITYPAADDRWATANFTSPPALVAGQTYFVVWDNTASAPATDFPQIQNVTIHTYESRNRQVSTCFSTGNGFSSAGTAQTEAPHILTFANGFSTGQIFTQHHLPFTNNTLFRGVVLPNIAKNFIYTGVYCSSIASVIRVYRSNQLPSDTPILTRTVTTEERSISTFVPFDTPLVLTGDTDFYLVQSITAANNGPLSGHVEDYDSVAVIIDEMYQNSLSFCRGVQDNGSNGWTLNSSSPTGLTLVPDGFNVSGPSQTSVSFYVG
jgi:hypothetical protein